VGWIAACILVVLMLPLLGMLYMDVLQTKKEAKRQQEQVQKLINQAKKEK
jgi:Tfp pilus assembly protein PilV